MEQLRDCFWWTFSDWENEISWQQPCLEGCYGDLIFNFIYLQQLLIESGDVLS